MAQQTAVEWLVQEFGLDDYKASIEFAKQKEKQQIMDAYWNGTTDMEKHDALIDAEKFYNEYYGKKN
jgi:hypothetical protein